MSSTNFRSILIFASCVVGTCNIVLALPFPLPEVRETEMISRSGVGNLFTLQLLLD